MLLAGGAAVVALAGGGVGVAYAASGSSQDAAAQPTSQSSASQSSTTPETAQQSKDGRAKRRKALLDRVEHGEFTVHTRKGDQVVDVQRGNVVLASASQLQVKSVDGFTASYAIGGDTKVRKAGKRSSIGDVHSADKVVVIATKNGSTTTAKSVRDQQK